MDSSDVPAPGVRRSFVADEIIIYGILLGERKLVAIKVVEGGENYPTGTSVTIEPPVATGTVKLKAGAIESVTLASIEEYDEIPTVKLTNTGNGKGARLVPIVKNTAKLDLEQNQGRWDVEIQGVSGGKDDPASFTIIAAYGYAFEGHCYRFDRPRILGFQHNPGDEFIGPLGCGFDPPAKGDAWYRGWRIRSSKRIIELNASVDRADELILKANLPGRRPPNTYDGHMRLAHRDGKLTGM